MMNDDVRVPVVSANYSTSAPACVGVLCVHFLVYLL